MARPDLNLKLYSGPAAEPVTLTNLKLYLRIDGTDHDTTLTALLAAAREYAQDVQNRAYVTQTWDWILDTWPETPLDLPYSPLASVTSITYTDIDGVAGTVSASSYLVDADSTPGRLVLKDGYNWPSVTLREIAGVKIRFQCGDATGANCPANTKLAIMLFAAHRFENPDRDDIPDAVDRLLMMDRVWWSK